MQGKASGRTVQQLPFFYLASLNYFPETRISSVVTLLAKTNFLAWGRESLVPKPPNELLHLCSWWQAAIFHEGKMVLACETAQFNPFICWPHAKEENVIIGRKECCGRMNPVFNRMCSFKEIFSAEYFKMLLLSYIPCLFLLGIQEQLLWPCSQSHHCQCKSLSWGEKCHLKGSSCALPPDRLFICFQISDQNFFPPSLLPLRYILHCYQWKNNLYKNLLKYSETVNFGITMPNCNGLPGNFYNLYIMTSASLCPLLLMWDLQRWLVTTQRKMKNLAIKQ